MHVAFPSSWPSETSTVAFPSVPNHYIHWQYHCFFAQVANLVFAIPWMPKSQVSHRALKPSERSAIKCAPFQGSNFSPLPIFYCYSFFLAAHCLQPASLWNLLGLALIMLGLCTYR